MDASRFVAACAAGPFGFLLPPYLRPPLELRRAQPPSAARPTALPTVTSAVRPETAAAPLRLVPSPSG